MARGGESAAQQPSLADLMAVLQTMRAGKKVMREEIKTMLGNPHAEVTERMVEVKREVKSEVLSEVPTKAERKELEQVTSEQKNLTVVICLGVWLALGPRLVTRSWV
ncbi:hypothetical protein GWK47_052184 [Chionoecetes opilio]|uniref:Uncharacterized protein n=1 Tax=Chionoecetes opilio TaxID=41210 RepID=A0A8J5CRK2_CHIOP|nr:hypothetical protein GWK47_052184 [Chionoecetes opilio]